MAFPSSDKEDIRKCREGRRDLFTSAQVNNPALAVPGDSPLQCLSAMQQKQAEKRLRAIAGAEGSALVDRDVPALIDSSVNLEANEETLLGMGGKLPVDERRQERMVEDTAEQAERARATTEIMDICEAMDDAGLDGARALEMLFEGEDEQVRQLLQGTDIAGGLEEIELTLEGVEGAFGTTFVTGAIAECRDQLAGPADGDVTPTQELLTELRQRFDVTAATPDEAFSQLEDRIRRADREGREAALNRLSRATGTSFEDVGEAIDAFRERIARARGERLLIGRIEVRRVSDEVRVRIEPGDVTQREAERFDQWRDNVERRVRRELDLGQLPSPSPWIDVGEILLRGEDLDQIDLEQGRERLGAVAEPQPLEEEQVDREQVELPTPETDADELARRALEALRQ